MKKNRSLIIAVVLTAASALAADVVDDNISEYKLPDGRVLRNPMVLDKNPEGLEIGHDRGVVFVRFADLPSDVQARYSYDPEKARQYAQSRKSLTVVKPVAPDTPAASKSSAAKSSVEAEMAKLELRIKFLNEEIPKLEAQQDKYVDKIAEVGSSRNSSSGNLTGSTNIYWRGGYISNAGSAAMRRDARTKSKVLAGMANEVGSIKQQLSSYKTELQQKTLRLESLKRNLQVPAK